MPDTTIDDAALVENGLFIRMDNELSVADNLLAEGKEQEAIDAVRQIKIPKDAFQKSDGLKCLADTYRSLFEVYRSYIGK